MTRIAALTIEQAPEAARPALQGVEKGLGFLPNAFATMAHSPAALNGYMALAQAMGKNSLTPAEREVVALAASQVNGCEYCVAAHSFFGGKSGLSEADMQAARAGTLNPVAVLARAVTLNRGQVPDGVLAEVRAGGLDNARIVDVIAQVTLLTLTNYLNNVARTEVDFPPRGA
ncbi:MULTISPECIES: carboxymuconolactone decarboxylase family protein [Pseudomonas]|uniref:Carboxymuconolactone decarboxylase family protein n=1 Tax=Pseudomonas putida TaxID=303 RepID=A0AAD0PFN4_PSEPU|nr:MULTISPECIES: carboxymuconolactone decarboxylase family protein [Pseudomonas]AXA24862.1 carboxymuconolactone decarboxylase family protein [Pseudomonas putida]MBH3458418.1 carboxymuconolactone decarboxylase family protein [Pseudomonas putida]MBK0057347.1 carboxymuconolactone decarboxylase family protein [Pseudomonas sp. S44]